MKSAADFCSWTTGVPIKSEWESLCFPHSWFSNKGQSGAVAELLVLAGRQINDKKKADKSLWIFFVLLALPLKFAELLYKSNIALCDDLWQRLHL